MTFKLIGNSMILGSLELLAEVFTLSEKAGIDAPLVYQWIKEMMPTPTYASLFIGPTSLDIRILQPPQLR